MSSLKVEVVSVDNISPHPNADRLEMAQVKGWTCVVPKGEFCEGDKAVYFPIDSILPEPLEAKLFRPESKIKLHKHRIKTIKLRGAISQGLLVPLTDLDPTLLSYQEGDDLAELLGVTKYEPPESGSPQSNCNQVSKKQVNPSFYKYTDIENYKNYCSLFTNGELVWVLEKIHGSNFRAGWVKSHPSTLWKKILNWFGWLPKYEFVYGSHNVQLQDHWANNGFYEKSIGKNIYWEAVEKYDLKHVLKPGDVVYGEIYGDGIQKGYLYDCKPGEQKLAVFDWQQNGVYVDHSEVIRLCMNAHLPTVPVDDLMEFNPIDVVDYVTIDSQLKPDLLREGVVIKPEQEQTCYIGRKILKWKNDSFLIAVEDNTH